MLVLRDCFDVGVEEVGRCTYGKHAESVRVSACRQTPSALGSCETSARRRTFAAVPLERVTTVERTFQHCITSFSCATSLSPSLRSALCRALCRAESDGSLDARGSTYASRVGHGAGGSGGSCGCRAWTTRGFVDICSVWKCKERSCFAGYRDEATSGATTGSPFSAWG